MQKLKMLVEKFKCKFVFLCDMFWFFRKKEDNKWKTLHRSLKGSFDNIKLDILDITDEFDEKHSRHGKKIEEIEKKLNHILNFIGNTEKNDEKVTDGELAIERVQSFNRSNQSFMNVQSFEKLTPAQKEVIALLVYTKESLGYESIATHLGLNIVTVRRHVNDILKLGVPLREEMKGRNRRKMFYLDGEAKSMVLREVKSVRKKR